MVSAHVGTAVAAGSASVVVVIGLIVMLVVRELSEAKETADVRFRLLKSGLGVFAVPLIFVFVFLVFVALMEALRAG